MRPANKPLPLEAKLLLQRAAETPITVDDPLARVKAVDHAIQRVKRDYPNFFSDEDMNHETDA